MSSFGDKLRELRESREISLDEIAESTKIGKRYLQALELNEFGELPGGVFAKGYIRTYAECLGVSPEPLLEAYVRELQSRGGGDPADDEKAARQAAHAALSKLAGTSADGPRWGFGPGAKYALLGVIGIGIVAALVWVLLGVLGNEPDESTVAAAAPPVARGAEPPANAVAQAMVPPTRDDDAAAQSQTEIAPDRPAAPPVIAERAAHEAAPVARSREEPEPVVEQVAERPPPQREPALVDEERSDVEPSRREPEVVTPPVTERAAAAGPASTPPREEPGEEAAAPSTLNVAEFGVGTDVVNRQLVGQSDRFTVGTRVAFWTRVLGGKRGDTIRHVWIREGRPIGTVELNIGAAHWRTQSRWTLRQGTGQWAVEARDAQDQVLARAEFDCVAPD